MKSLITALPSEWENAIWAALTGDAFGVPHEGKRSDAIPEARCLEMVMPDDYEKSYGAIPYGTWSDDGAQMLALLDALMSVDLQSDQAFEECFTQNLLSWYFEGKFQIDEHVFDCGGQTRNAIMSLSKGNRPAPSDRCGNGSLMRVLPVAAMPDADKCDERTALRIAMLQSDLTHPNPMARVSCALHVELAWKAKDSAKRTPRLYELVHVAARSLLDRQLLDQEEMLALSALMRFGAQNMPSNDGFAANMFWSALWAVDRGKNLSSILRQAVSLGHDTDTAACLSGGLGAIVYHRQPWDAKMKAWHQALRLPELSRKNAPKTIRR